MGALGTSHLETIVRTGFEWHKDSTAQEMKNVLSECQNLQPDRPLPLLKLPGWEKLVMDTWSLRYQHINCPGAEKTGMSA